MPVAAKKPSINSKAQIPPKPGPLSKVKFALQKNVASKFSHTGTSKAKKSSLKTKSKPAETATKGKNVNKRRGSKVEPVVQSATIIKSGLAVVQAPLIYGEIPPSIDTSKLKLSIKQVFVKKNREYPILPKAIHPTQYFLNINPQLDLFAFKATVLILAEVRQPVQKIIMNSVDLRINSVFVYKNAEEAKSYELLEDPKKSLKFKSVTEEETLEISLTSQLSDGTCAIRINFNGTITDQMKGFHCSRFTNYVSETFYTFLTKCQPCDARRIFPCFDEPEYKAKFNLTLTVPKKATVLANMPEKETKKAKTTREVTFEETPPMPTFLFAFVVGNFKFQRGNTSRGVKVRVFSPMHAHKRTAKFALNIAIKAIDYMENYTGMPFTETKMDLVPIEEMNIESQCNLGLCMFRDDAILIVGPREKTGSLNECPTHLYQKIALLVSRAVVDQWVGNKVTMQWWSDVWLNVGLGTFLEYLCVNAIIEQFQILQQFGTIVSENALRIDLCDSIHPLKYDLQDPPDIEETYDEITSDKGASVIRMLYDFIGFAPFQKGLIAYIQSEDRETGVAEDLWKAIEKETETKVNIVELMKNWTLATGYPLVIVTNVVENKAQTIIKAHQQQFAATVESVGSKTQGWQIPIRVVSSSDPGRVIHTEIVKNYDFSIHIEDTGVSWVMLNPGRTGYFRVGYGQHEMEKIFVAIQQRVMAPMDRVVVLQDAFAMAISGYSSVVDLLRLLQAYMDEDDYHVWRAIDDVVHELDCYISYATKEAYERYQQHILFIYKNIETTFGKDAFVKKNPPIHEYIRFLRQRCRCCSKDVEPNHKDHIDCLLFGLIIKRMCIFGHESTLAWARDVFISAANDESDIHPDVYPAVAIGFAQWKENEENLHLIFRAYRRANSIQEKEIILEGFSLFRANTHIRKILQFAISDSVSLAHTPLIMARCSVTKLGRHMAWYFFKEHIPHFSREYYQNEQLLKPIFRHILCYFMSDERLQDVKEFFNQHGFQGLQRTVEETLDCIRRNIAWSKRDLAKVNYFLLNLTSNEIVENKQTVQKEELSTPAGSAGNTEEH